MRKTRFLVLSFLLFSFSLLFAQTTPSPTDVEKRVDSILRQMTLEEKIDYLGGFNDFYVRSMPKLGLPALKMADGPVGIRNYGPSTALAGGIGLAASWDPELARRVGEVLGEDARARGVHFLLGPGVNIYRAPMNGRNFEYFGEDPFLSSRIAVAYVEGVQSKRVCATIKHFMGNNSEYDRHNVDSIIDERTMREIYLPTFEAAVKEAHVCSIMDSYNLTNGEHLTQNNYLNNEVAKKDWGFDGIMMSDWNSTYDGVAAANGGLDLEMPSGKFMNRETLLPAIKAGRVNEATIDEHVRRILRKTVQFGWLDSGYEQTDLSISLYNPDGRAVSLEAARAGTVLLKNDGNLLPLNKSQIKTLAVIGPGAYPASPVGGGSAQVRPFNSVSYLEGLAAYLGDSTKVMYSPGIGSPSQMAESTSFVTGAMNGQPGLKAEYFSSLDLSGPVRDMRTDKHLNFGPDHPLGNDFQSARWTGYYLAKNAGSYHVFLQSLGEEGGVRFFLDDKLVVDEWKIYRALVDDLVLDLTAGPHKIRVEAYRKANWNGPGLRLGMVSASAMVTPEARALAAKADAVVVAVGFDPAIESEGADRSFRLPPGQDELIQAMLPANKNVIVVVTAGGAVDMNTWVDHTPALLQAWYSGQEGGTALAQLLFGEYSPSGRLPITYDRRLEDNASYRTYYYPSENDKKVKYSEGVFLGYRYYDKAGTKPLFPFGYGLSYTSFGYQNLAVSPATFSGDQPVTVSFDITNTGKQKGAEVAQVYVGDKHASVLRPVKELKGFAKLELNPGEARHVSVALNRRSFSYYDVKNRRWTAESGDFDIYVGRSAAQIELTGKVTLKSQ
jgi:beta-glucosidase